MGGGDVCDLCPSANTYLVSAETESDEKQYSCSVERPHTSPSGGAFGSEDSTRASFTMGRNRSVTLDSAPPSSRAMRSKRADSACFSDQCGPASRFSGVSSAPIAGIACRMMASYCCSALRQEEQTTRCSCSLLWSSSLSWPEVETAQSSRNSSWGSVWDNAPAPRMNNASYD